MSFAATQPRSSPVTETVNATRKHLVTVTIRHSMVARRMRCAPGKPQQPASPARRSPNRARSHCSSNSPRRHSTACAAASVLRKGGPWLEPRQISGPDRIRRRVRAYQRRARGIPREHRRSDPEARRTYHKPPLFPVEENLYEQLRMERDGKLATCEIPGRAAHMQYLRGSGECVAIRQATRRRTPRKEDGRRGFGVRTSRRRTLGIHRTAHSKGPPCAPIAHHTQPQSAAHEKTSILPHFRPSCIKILPQKLSDDPQSRSISLFQGF